MYIMPEKKKQPKKQNNLIWISKMGKGLEIKKKSTDWTHSISVIRQIQIKIIIPVAEQDEDNMRKTLRWRFADKWFSRKFLNEKPVREWRK